MRVCLKGKREMDRIKVGRFLLSVVSNPEPLRNLLLKEDDFLFDITGDQEQTLSHKQFTSRE